MRPLWETATQTPCGPPPYWICVIAVTDLPADVNDTLGIPYERMVNQMEDTMSDNFNNSLDTLQDSELDLVVGGIVHRKSGENPIEYLSSSPTQHNASPTLR